MHHIAVVDSVKKRGQALLQSCARCYHAAELYHCTSSKIWKYVRDTGHFKDALEIGHCDVAFRHYRNSQIRLHPVPQVEIWYGGDGAEPARKKRWNINVALRSAADVNKAIPPDALKELLQWAMRGAPDRRNLPALVRSRVNMEVLPALAVLCEGYFVVHSEHGGPEREHASMKTDIGPALRAMGWNEGVAKVCRQLTLRDLGEAIKAVRTSKWWAAVFGLTTKEGTLSPDRCRKFCDAVIKEWDTAPSHAMPEDVGSLVAAVCSLVPGSKKPKAVTAKERETILGKPRLVAGAYCAIAERLKGDA